MKLSSETIAVLQNFSKLNSGIEFKKSKSLSTISTNKAVLVKATIDEEFPENFCVYDLNQFLMICSLNKDAEMSFDNSNILFKSGKTKTTFRKADKSLILTPPDKELNFPQVDATFQMSEEVYNTLMKNASVLQSRNIVFESDGDKVYVTACDMTNDSANFQTIELGEGNGSIYKISFLVENIKMIPGTYDVQVSSKGISSFKNVNGKIEYWVAVENNESKFGD